MRFIVFQGGLGNQMFQYGYYKMMLSRFPKLSYQFAYGNSHNGFELDKWFNVDMRRASLFWKLLFEIIYFLKIKGIIDLIVSEEQYPQKDGWFVAGYWQDKRYFKKGFLHFKKMKFNSLNADALKKISTSQSVSIHIRRGDYIKPPYDKIYGGICTLEYYQKAINIVKKEFHDPFFFIFSDDIEWVKENLKLDTNNVLFIDWNKGNDSVYDMFLMSKAKANIIANSTFSFWGAFLNEESKITVCPRKWFNQGFKDPDIIPESWIRI